MRSKIDLFLQYYSTQGPVVLLESQSEVHPTSRFTYLAARPEATITARGQEIKITCDNHVSKFDSNPWEALTHFYKKHKSFLFGYLGYDLKNHKAPLLSDNQDDIEAPDLFFMVPSLLLRFDHSTNRIDTLKGKLPDDAIPSFSEKDAHITNIQSTIKQDEYISKIDQIHHDIYEGEYYELNFTHQLKGHFSGSPYNLYRMMRQAGPVPFGAFLAFDNLAICCASPERFLNKKGQSVISQPIKGTIKRSQDEAKDQQLKQSLRESSKDRAENIMIVDLVRNDLSHIARKGSVDVRKLFDIQSFSSVHQMISTVTASADTENPIDIIKACFPMGSMTGAPKINVMRHIDELETYKRGIYSGAIGYITPMGNFDFNVVIRTAIIAQYKLYYAVGGAITADSDPQEEWEESWLKAEALLRSVNN